MEKTYLGHRLKEPLFRRTRPEPLHVTQLRWRTTRSPKSTAATKKGMESATLPIITEMSGVTGVGASMWAWCALFVLELCRQGWDADIGIWDWVCVNSDIGDEMKVMLGGIDIRLCTVDSAGCLA